MFRKFSAFREVGSFVSDGSKFTPFQIILWSLSISSLVRFDALRADRSSFKFSDPSRDSLVPFERVVVKRFASSLIFSTSYFERPASHILYSLSNGSPSLPADSLIKFEMFRFSSPSVSWTRSYFSESRARFEWFAHISQILWSILKGSLPCSNFLVPVEQFSPVSQILDTPFGAARSHNPKRSCFSQIL